VIWGLHQFLFGYYESRLKERQISRNDRRGMVIMSSTCWLSTNTEGTTKLANNHNKARSDEQGTSLNSDSAVEVPWADLTFSGIFEYLTILDERGACKP
jgi:hypothetical protein